MLQINQWSFTLSRLAINVYSFSSRTILLLYRLYRIQPMPQFVWSVISGPAFSALPVPVACGRRKVARGRVLPRGDIPGVVRRRRSRADGACALRAHVAWQVRGARHGPPRLSVKRPGARRPALLWPSQLPHPRPGRRAREPPTLSA